MRRVHADFETASKAELKDIGAFAYAQHPSTFVLCLSWCDPDEPGEPQVWLPGDPAPDWVQQAADRECEVHAFNAQFEWCILNWTCYRLYGWPRMPIRSMRCTLAQARYWGYGGRLEDTARALNTTEKDGEGHALMLRMSKPRKRQSGESWWHEDDPDRYQRLIDYCRQDVRVEVEIAAKLPPLPPAEQIVFEYDMAINARGVRIDRDLVARLETEIDAEAGRLDAHMVEVTDGEITTTRSPGPLRKWAISRQPEIEPYLPDLQRETLEDVLDADKTEPLRESVRQALETRRLAAKTSVAKVPKMGRSVCMDGRLRGILAYYGAARTGRWAGRLLQPQNLPRGEIPKPFDAGQLAERILDGESAPALAREIGIPVMTLISGLVRACLIPTEFEHGGMLLAPDYGQIEARVIAWLAGQRDVLDVFATGQDVYAYTAAQVTGGPMPAKDDPLRQYGKVIVLGTGFGMGPPKFRDTAAKSKVLLTEQEAKEAVYGWRDANTAIVGLWHNLESTAWDLLYAAGRRRSPLDRIAREVPDTGGKLAMGVGPSAHDPRDVTMSIRLPSGRELVYPRLRVGRRRFKNEAGRMVTDDRDQLCYDGVDQTSGQWGRVFTYGGKLAENVTQACARDVMAGAIVRLFRAGYQPVLTVHDEVVVDLPASCSTEAELPGHVNAVERTMLFEDNTPKWMAGLPLAVEATAMTRYRK